MDQTRSVFLQQLNIEHIQSLVDLSTSVGWDYEPEDIETILATGIVYGHVTREGRVVSSTAIFPYGPMLASIGVVITHPDFRGMGLAKQVMKACMDHFPNVPSMLIATALGKPLYERLGFHVAGTVHKFLCDSFLPNENFTFTHPIEPMKEAEVAQVIQLDALSVGVERADFMRARLGQATRRLTIKNDFGDIIGFGLAVQGPHYLVLGPVVAPDDSLAYQLMLKLAENHDGKLRMDVPSEKTALIELLPLHGFVLNNVPPVMLINAEQLPLRDGSLFAISSQAFG